MADYENKTVAKVYSQYEKVKDYVATLHIGFLTAVIKMQALKISGRKNTPTFREHSLNAFQNLAHLRHLGVLSGAILNKDDSNLAVIDDLLEHWEKASVENLKEVIKFFENWFAASYFYDVRVNDENTDIVDIKGSLKAAGL